MLPVFVGSIKVFTIISMLSNIKLEIFIDTNIFNDRAIKFMR